MGFFSKLIYATLIPKKVREAAALDELKKQNKILAKMAKKKKINLGRKKR